MKLICLSIYLTCETADGWDRKVYCYESPKGKIAKGIRFRIGWFFVRLGLYVIYGNKGINTFK